MSHIKFFVVILRQDVLWYSNLSNIKEDDLRIFGRKLKLVVLDVDGVFVDNWAHLEHVITTTAEEFGFPTDRVPQYFARVNTPDWKPNLKAGVQAMWPELNDKQIEAYCLKMRQNETKLKFEAFPRAIETIRIIPKYDIKLALCTANNKSALNHRLRCIGLDYRTFCAATTYESKYQKPHGQALLGIFDQLRIAPRSGVFVGDWLSDLETARNAQVDFVAITTGQLTHQQFRQQGVPKDHIIDSLCELLDLITC